MKKVSDGANWADLTFLTSSAVCSLIKLPFWLGSLSVYGELSVQVYHSLSEKHSGYSCTPRPWTHYSISSVLRKWYEAIVQMKLNLEPHVITFFMVHLVIVFSLSLNLSHLVWSPISHCYLMIPLMLLLHMHVLKMRSALLFYFSYNLFFNPHVSVCQQSAYQMKHWNLFCRLASVRHLALKVIAWSDSSAHASLTCHNPTVLSQSICVQHLSCIGWSNHLLSVR